MAAPPSRAADADYVSLAALRYHIRRFLAFSEEMARAAGVEPQQHQLLLALEALPPETRPTIRVVADRLLINHNSAVELAQRAASRGLIERRTGKEDRREAALHVTARGKRLLRSLSLAHRRELRSAAPELIRTLEAILGAGVRRPRSQKKQKGRKNR